MKLVFSCKKIWNNRQPHSKQGDLEVKKSKTYSLGKRYKYLCCMNNLLLLAAKLQIGSDFLSAMPINRRCGFRFRKVSSPFKLSFIPKVIPCKCSFTGTRIKFNIGMQRHGTTIIRL